MKAVIDKKLVKFYVWVALAYATLWLLSNLSTFPGTFLQAVGNNIWRAGYLIVVNFIFLEYTVPFVIRKRKYIIYNILLAIPALWVHCLLWSYGMYAWRLLGIQLHIFTHLTTLPSPGNVLTGHRSLENVLTSQMAYSVGAAFFYGIVKQFYSYIKLKQAAQQLQIEKQAAELNYLKSQTNPHFLFNTLNNIYSLARDKSDLAPESILRLSKILRYMLYETGGEFIAIEQELRIMNDYIDLEKLRYDDSLRVNFNHDIEDMKQA